MLENQVKLKNFILWCQKNKVKHFKNNDIEFELSEIAFLPGSEQYKEISLKDYKNIKDSQIDLDQESMTKEEEDELLFWSAGAPSKG